MCQLRYLIVPVFSLCAAVVAIAAEPIASKVLLKTSASWSGSPIAYPAGQAEVQMLQLEIPKGGITLWHRHPVPSFAYVLQGKLRVELEDRTQREFQTGDAFAEVVNTWHRGANIGNEPVRLLVTYTGAQGTPLTVAKSDSH